MAPNTTSIWGQVSLAFQFVWDYFKVHHEAVSRNMTCEQVIHERTNTQIDKLFRASPELRELVHAQAAANVRPR